MKKVLLTATVQSHICQFHRPLVEVLRENGDVEIHVAARNNLAEKNGLALDFADCVFDIPFQRSPLDPKNLVAYRQLKRVIRKGGYDIIHCNTPVGGVLTRLAAAGTRKRGAKVIYTAHGFHFFRGASWKNWLIYYPIEWLLARLTDVLITINEEDFALAKKRFACPVSRIHGTGVSADRYKPVDDQGKLHMKRKLGYAPEDRLILSVGELLPNKNQKMAVEAMAEVIKQCPEAILLLAGNGPEQKTLEERIHQMNLDSHVRLLGYCTNLQDYQQAADISVACSYREGLPLNVIESMLCRNPVVATRNRGHNELICDKKNGFLVDTGDVAGMAEKLSQLLSSPEQCAEMGIQAENLAQTYTTAVVKQELKDIYCL